MFILCFWYFVLPTAPSSCVVTEWAEWDPCSVTCGLGMRRRERMVKMPPIDGSMCKTEVAEVEKCMMPECRKSSDTKFHFSGVVILCFYIVRFYMNACKFTLQFNLVHCDE